MDQGTARSDLGTPMRSEYDCLVVGGGPAGCTAAALVAEADVPTLLVERESIPRFHVGESLMPETYWTLKRLGVLDQLKVSNFTRKVGVRFVGASGGESQPFFFDQHDPRDCAQTWHVERHAFDKLLFDTAAARGATCLDQTTVVDVQLNESAPHTVTLKLSNGDRREVTCRVLVDATGQQALLANRLGLRQVNPKLRKAAIWGHFRNAIREPEGEPELTTIIHTAGKRAWFWYIPLSGDCVSVGLVSDAEYLLKGRGEPDKVFCEEAVACPGVAERLENAQLVERLHVAREFSYTTRERAGDGWVLVGDAYGFIDPIYSTGVFLALRSGELAADAIVEGLRIGDLSSTQLAKWTPDFDAGVGRFRELVNAYYTDAFSFAKFIEQHPYHQRHLTDLLIGRAFTPEAESLVSDLQQAVAVHAEESHAS